MRRAAIYFITCKELSLLARNYSRFDKVGCRLPAPRICDQGLVTTRSFTNMVIAGLFLDRSGDAAGYLPTASSLREPAQAQLLKYTQALAEVATRPFHSVLFWGDGCRYGAAMENGLKMLEITNGGIDTRAGTFLGLQHGPVCAIRPDTLAVAFRPPMPGVDDSSAAVLDVIVGQLLAFFRALPEGFQPDSPSLNGVINRVVSGFRIHDARQGAHS